MNLSSSALVIVPVSPLPVPALIAQEGAHTAKRFLEFFVGNIRNSNRREAYACAVSQFLHGCEERGAGLRDIEPMIVVEQHTGAIPTVKQHLAAIRMLID